MYIVWLLAVSIAMCHGVLCSCYEHIHAIICLPLQSVTSVQPDSEDGHFYLGRYYDRLKSVLASDRLTKSA